MPDQPYLNREIDERLGDIKDVLVRIESQTTKTNGRVTKLERWQNYVLGFCACVSLLLVTLTAVVVAFIGAGKI